MTLNSHLHNLHIMPRVNELQASKVLSLSLSVEDLMMELGGGFRLRGGRSFSKLGRSNSSLLLSESITAECARVACYERLSESMSLSTDPAGFGLRHGGGGGRGRARGRVASFLTRVFNLGRAPAAVAGGGGREAEECGTAKAIKKRSSWLPDPDRRWPVQGW